MQAIFDQILHPGEGVSDECGELARANYNPGVRSRTITMRVMASATYGTIPPQHPAQVVLEASKDGTNWDTILSGDVGADAVIGTAELQPDDELRVRWSLAEDDPRTTCYWALRVTVV